MALINRKSLWCRISTAVKRKIDAQLHTIMRAEARQYTCVSTVYTARHCPTISDITERWSTNLETANGQFS